MNGKLQIPHHYLDGVSFSLYNSSEVVKLSVKELVSPQAFDQLGHATIGGLYDPALGITDRDDACKTCGLGEQLCPGHMGHIRLALACYNPAFFKVLHQILRGTCFECHKISAKMKTLHSMKCQLKALDYGLIHLVGKLKEILGDKERNKAEQKENKEDKKTEGGQNENQDQSKEKSKALTPAERQEKELLEEEEIMNKLTKALNEGLQEIDEKEAKYDAQVKNVVEMRLNLVKEFISGRHFQKSKCAHCKAVIRPLKTEYNSRMFFASLSKQTISKLRDKLTKKKKKKKTAKGDEEEEGDFEEEMGDIVEIHEAERIRQEEKDKIESYSNQEMLTPPQAKKHLGKVWKHDGELLSQFLGALKLAVDDQHTDVFFVETLPVPPSKYRPVVAMKDMRLEGAQTKNFSKVLEANNELKGLIALSQADDIDVNEPDAGQTQDATNREDKRTLIEKIQMTWTKLQSAVNTVFDSDLDKLSTDKQNGIKQLLEKKEGLFRKHMMGKRVNFAARSVISPDPYINTNEIGIPEVFAKKLFYPQPVTHWNFTQLKQAVINGPDVHPGALNVIQEDGSIVRLSKNKTQREAIAKQLLTPSTHADHTYGTKKVCRHLQNGDVLLLNRQPTLHKPSIQAHKARVLTGEKTIRLHYANCKAYNADFDGDEMNAHFPQDEVSRAEAYNIALTDFQYLVPKDGTPLAGLIQDHMVSGVHLTIRGRFFNKQDYQQLVFGALTNKTGPVLQLPPSVLKPKQLWSGKQVLSTVLLNIIPEGKPPLNLTGKSKISEKSFRTRDQVNRTYIEFDQSWPMEMDESRVVIQDGELLVGVLDKGHYGATAYGLVHSCYELYGGEMAGKLLTCLAKLFTCFLQFRGFTLGVEDILCQKKADKKRRRFMQQGAKKGSAAAATAVDLEENVDSTTLFNKLQEAHFRADGSGLKDLDLAMKGCTDEIQNEIAKHLMPIGLQKMFPHNNLQLMVQSGAKGTTVNCMQISCLLGQIELEGRRPPLMLSGQSLPSFPAYETSPRAGGFVDGRFLTGIKPQEYFFHCMAGREGLVDTAVKTSRSGYLQRCIIKHLEGLAVAYDQSVRDSDGSIVQFQYGEDGLEVPKTKFLNTKQFPFLIANQDVVPSEAPPTVNETEAKQKWKEYRKWRKKNKGRNRFDRKQPFTVFCEKNFNTFLKDYNNEEHSKDTGRTQATEAILKQWWSNEGKRNKLEKFRYKELTPVAAALSPAKYLGTVTERFEELINSYVENNPDELICENGDDGPVKGRKYISPEKLRSLLYVNYMRSLVVPGEAVGLVAAQSIGEPSTQMTLNTFHFAGRGEMNVTLGIPRLREILMVASANIKTPTMDIPLFKCESTGQNEDKKKATELKKKLNKVFLSQVLEDVEVTECLSVKTKRNKGRIYKIRFQFLPHEIYEEEFCVTPYDVLTYMEERFFKKMTKDIEDKKKALAKTTLLSTSRIRASQKEKETDEEEKSEQPEAGDAAKENDDDMSGDEQHDDDALADKVRAKKDEENDYEGEEEEKEQVDEEESDAEADDTYYVGDEQEGEKTAESEKNKEKVSKAAEPSKSTPQRITNVKASISGCQDYAFDVENELWCEITIKIDLSAKKLDMTSCIEGSAKKAVLYEVKHINRCFVAQSKLPEEKENGVWRVKTEGVNIQEVYKYEDILNIKKLYTNDIHAMAKNYGIEAACRVLIKEIRDVFANYGIQVDYRHLTLIADYMTFEGEYKAFNRLGLESNASPLQKMTFETTMHFLRTATITGARDDLKSPSSRLVTGQLVKGGTGAFEVMQKLIL